MSNKNIVETDNGHLVVFDDLMGRRMSNTGKAFDFDKLEKAIEILCANLEGMTFVDVGANIGSMCVEALNAGYFSHAIAIEPEPKNLALLKANIAINELDDRIDLHQCAVGEVDDSTITMELSEINTGDHRIQITKENGRFGEAHRETITVPSCKLDTVTDGKSNLFLCIDTQGFEGQVLSGGSKTLQNTKALLMEFWPYGLSRSGGYKKVKQALLNSHFTKFMNEEISDEWHDLTEETLDRLYNRLNHNNKYTDLIIA